MPIVTAGDVVALTNTSKTESEIEDLDIIAEVQARVADICNNQFTVEIFLQDSMDFDASARTITADNSFTDEGFADGDEIYVYGSYRNDGYYQVSTVADEVLTLIAGESVVAELSGQSILVSLVQWPKGLRLIAAQMVKYDLDDRAARSADVTSRSLGPFSESYGGTDPDNPYGYPNSIINQLSTYRIARVM